MARATRAGSSVALTPELARQLREWHARGDSDGSIAQRLNAAGGIWKRSTDDPFFGQRGVWTPGRVAEWLTVNGS